MRLLEDVAGGRTESLEKVLNHIPAKGKAKEIAVTLAERVDIPRLARGLALGKAKEIAVTLAERVDIPRLARGLALEGM